MDDHQCQDIDSVFQLLERANLLEKSGQRIEAATKYYEGCHLMRQIVSRFPKGSDDDPILVLLREKIQEYTLQAQRLYFDERSVIHPIPRKNLTPATIIVAPETSDEVSVLTFPGNQSSVLSGIHKNIRVANARMEHAIQLEERNNSSTVSKESIIKSYLNAAEAYLSALKACEEVSEQLPSIAQSRLESCLDRVEALKKTTR